MLAFRVELTDSQLAFNSHIVLWKNADDRDGRPKMLLGSACSDLPGLIYELTVKKYFC